MLINYIFCGTTSFFGSNGIVGAYTRTVENSYQYVKNSTNLC